MMNRKESLSAICSLGDWIVGLPTNHARWEVISSSQWTKSTRIRPSCLPDGVSNGQKFILNRSFKLVWGERSELVGWSTESKPGSTSFHDCCLRRTGTHQKLLHRKRKNAVARRAVLQASSPKHLEHLPVSQSADRSGCRLAIDAGPAGDVAKRGSGGPAWLCVTVQDEPERQLGPAQVGHAGIDEGVEKLEAKPGNPLRSLPPGGRIAPLAHGSTPSLSLATRL